MYIDFHIHYLPNLVPEEMILSEMDKHEVEKSVVLATPDHPRYTMLNLTGTNEESWNLVSRHPGRLVMAAYIDRGT